MIIIFGMIAEVASILLGLALAYGIAEMLFSFGVQYAITQIVYWILLVGIISILSYYTIVITQEYTKTYIHDEMESSAK